MSVPSRAEAVAIVRELRPNDKLLRHSTAVAEVAAFLAEAMTRRGVAVDATLIEVAALLHDIDKMLPADHPLKPLGHGAAGAAWLRERGHDELAPAVAGHPVMEIGRAPTYDAWADAAGLAGRVVSYSDKRARQTLIRLDSRFARWHDHYPDSPDLDVAHERARRLEQEISQLAGVKPADVRRRAWVREQMRAPA
jgi:putative nucleotidyltransferase with HDIG domain